MVARLGEDRRAVYGFPAAQVEARFLLQTYVGNAFPFARFEQSAEVVIGGGGNSPAIYTSRERPFLARFTPAVQAPAHLAVPLPEMSRPLSSTASYSSA